MFPPLSDTKAPNGVYTTWTYLGISKYVTNTSTADNSRFPPRTQTLVWRLVFIYSPLFLTSHFSLHFLPSILTSSHPRPNKSRSKKCPASLSPPSSVSVRNHQYPTYSPSSQLRRTSIYSSKPSPPPPSHPKPHPLSPSPRKPKLTPPSQPPECGANNPCHCKIVGPTIGFFTTIVLAVPPLPLIHSSSTY